MAILNCAQNSEFNLFEEFNGAQNSEFVYSDELNCAQNSEFTVYPEINCAQNSEFYYINSEVMGLILGEDAGGYSGYIVPEVVPSLTVNSQAGTIDYSPWIREYKITKVLGGKTHVDVTLIQYGDEDPTTPAYDDFIVRPQSDQLNPIYSSICSSAFKFHGYSANRWFIFKLSVGHPGVGWQDYTFPYLLPSNLEFDGTELHSFLEDFTVLLEKDDQSMEPDINADAGLIGYAHSTIRAICTQYNIPSVVINFPDYLLRLLRRNRSQPISWIDQILRVYQAKRNFIGKTLVINQSFTAEELTPKWHFNAR